MDLLNNAYLVILKQMGSLNNLAGNCKIFALGARTKFTYLNDLRKYLLKKYCYTVNHKRLGLNYFYFSL